MDKKLQKAFEKNLVLRMCSAEFGGGITLREVVKVLHFLDANSHMNGLMQFTMEPHSAVQINLDANSYLNASNLSLRVKHTGHRQVLLKQFVFTFDFLGSNCCSISN